MSITSNFKSFSFLYLSLPYMWIYMDITCVKMHPHLIQKARSGWIQELLWIWIQQPIGLAFTIATYCEGIVPFGIISVGRPMKV